MRRWWFLSRFAVIVHVNKDHLRNEVFPFASWWDRCQIAREPIARAGRWKREGYGVQIAFTGKIC